jgi:hypothetical protein
MMMFKTSMLLFMVMAAVAFASPSSNGMDVDGNPEAMIKTLGDLQSDVDSNNAGLEEACTCTKDWVCPECRC